VRLSTRLSLSYLGFLVLLAALVLVLAGLQVGRLARQLEHLPAPGSPNEAGLIAEHLAKEGLTATIPQEWLTDTLAVNGWAQVVDESGAEVTAVGAPPDRSTRYSAPELAVLADPYQRRDARYSYTLAPIERGQRLSGMIILAIPRSEAAQLFGGRLTTAIARSLWTHFFTGVGMAVLAAVLLALLVGVWYARRIARPLVRLSAELKATAAGDFSHRVPVQGKDEFAVLAVAYNDLAERLGAAQRERDRTEQARRDLVANISHDLRTPLTSVRGFTEALADPATPPESRQRYAALVGARIRELDAMLADLLELSRLQALPALKREPVDLPELVREQVIALMPQLEQAGLEVDVDLPDDLPPVALDGRLIGRALQNLLANAARHSSGASRVGVALFRSEGGLALEVSDNGPGIPAADLPMLFERYYQGTSATNRQRGTGLGLAIVRQIAENHGGRVGVRTAEGQGTTFTIWLPVSG
jgi:signal transduction histidine kinase